MTEEGKVTDVKVLRGVNAELDKEAVRVISGSPLWTPGRDENGEAVLTLPAIVELDFEVGAVNIAPIETEKEWKIIEVILEELQSEIFSNEQ